MTLNGRAPTITDVALLAGVSRTTVSHALAGKGRVDPATRERVQAATEQLGYRPNPRARRLRGGRAHAVAILTALPPSIVGERSQMGFLLDMAMSTARACLMRGYSLVLVPPGAGIAHLDDLDIDGAIVIDPLAHDPNCAALSSRGVQIVTVGESAGAAADAVVDRGDAGMRAMLVHLADRGARHVAVVVTAERYGASAYLDDLLVSDDIPAGIELVAVHVDAGIGETAAEEEVTRLLEERPDIDAVYAPLDAFAVGAATAARRAGRRIGSDLLVATNYDGPRAGASDPPMTVLDLDLAGLAQGAAELLMDLLDGSDRRRIDAPSPRVIARASTAGVRRE